MDQILQFLKDNPEAWAALAAFSAGPAEGVRRLLMGYQRNRYLTEALLRISAKHSEEVSLLRRENAQLIEKAANDMRLIRESHQRQTQQLIERLLRQFSSRL